MAVNYLDLFEDIGKFVKAANQLRAVGITATGATPHLPSLETDIINMLGINGTERIGDGLHSVVEAFKDQFASAANDMADYVSARLTDRDTILNELPGLQASDPQSVLVEIIRDMANLGAAATIKRSVVSLGVTQTPTAIPNTGNGVLLLTKRLDGAASPSPGMPPHPLYKDVNSELVVPNDSMTFTCIQDSDFGGLPSGHEIFLAEGAAGRSNPMDWKSEGSGVRVTMRTDNANDVLIANKDFESFQAATTLSSQNNIPTNWTVDTGAPGTHLIQETASANIFRGNACLRLEPGSDVLFHQTIPFENLIPDRLYRASFRLKTDSITAGTLVAQIISPSGAYTFAAGDIKTVSLAGVGTLNYGLHEWLISMPSNMPDDLRFQFSLTGLAGTAIWLDSLALNPVNYIGGVGYNMIAGSIPFNRTDRITVVNTSVEGVLQAFFRRKFGVMLPSASSPAFADSLAQ